MCLAHGHPDAPSYRLGRLYDEAALITERENGRLITVNDLLMLAVHSLLSKKARTELSKRVKQLNIETKAHPGLFE